MEPALLLAVFDKEIIIIYFVKQHPVEKAADAVVVDALLAGVGVERGGCLQALKDIAVHLVVTHVFVPYR
jgi:hypothetical protein